MHDKASCCLCNQIAGNRENDLISQLAHDEQYVRRIAMESENFAVIPSLGPLVPGHTLLCPKEHVKSIASLQVGLFDEYLRMKKDLCSALNYIFDAPVHYFEHGTASRSSRIICTVDHAHLHLLPANANVMELVIRRLPWRLIEPTLNGIKKMVGIEEYLYYESADGVTMVVTGGEDGFESQYMRKAFAEAIGIPTEWNWRENPRPEQADKTFRAISELSREWGI